MSSSWYFVIPISKTAPIKEKETDVKSTGETMIRDKYIKFAVQVMNMAIINVIFCFLLMEFDRLKDWNNRSIPRMIKE
ncbi:MAG: hypothetical protein WDA59_03985 [Methanofastidiosum sp.]